MSELATISADIGISIRKSLSSMHSTFVIRIRIFVLEMLPAKRTRISGTLDMVVFYMAFHVGLHKGLKTATETSVFGREAFSVFCSNNQ